MSNEKDVQVLEHKIAMLEKKITNFEKNKISKKKKMDLLMKKLKYETELEEMQFS